MRIVQECSAELFTILWQDQIIVKVDEKELRLHLVEKCIHIAAPTKPLLVHNYFDPRIEASESTSNLCGRVCGFIDGNEDPDVPVGLPLSAPQGSVNETFCLIGGYADSDIRFSNSPRQNSAAQSPESAHAASGSRM
jgi:hypothetical protein